MAERWYRAIRISGRRKPADVVQLVSKFIENNQLGDYVPRLCVQKLPRGKRRDEFYLFLGVLSAQKGDTFGNCPIVKHFGFLPTWLAYR